MGSIDLDLAYICRKRACSTPWRTREDDVSWAVAGSFADPGCRDAGNAHRYGTPCSHALQCDGDGGHEPRGQVAFAGRLCRPVKRQWEVRSRSRSGPCRTHSVYLYRNQWIVSEYIGTMGCGRTCAAGEARVEEAKERQPGSPAPPLCRLAEIRGSALESLRSARFPTNRVEDFRFTDLSPLAKSTLAAPGKADASAARALVDQLALQQAVSTASGSAWRSGPWLEPPPPPAAGGLRGRDP